MSEIAPTLTTDVDETIQKWILDSVRWERIAEEEGVDRKTNSYEEILPQLDFICEKLVPAAIERVKFLNSHTHDFDVHESCIHCGIWIGDVSSNG